VGPLTSAHPHRKQVSPALFTERGRAAKCYHASTIVFNETRHRIMQLPTVLEVGLPGHPGQQTLWIVRASALPPRWRHITVHAFVVAA